MDNNRAKRIVSIDLIRAFAVVMMIQGHTIHSLLSTSYSNSGYLLYDVWLFFRALTAPLFIFTSGFIFTFLLLKNGNEFKNNARVKKGLKRALSLILIGYLLRYPTINILRITETSYSQWLTFFAVDALHLIGVGLLLIIVTTYVAFKIKLNPIIPFILFVVSIFAFSPIITSIHWSLSVNIFLVSYLTKQFGTIFPLFPYLLYIFLGAIFGTLLAYNSDTFRNLRIIIAILILGTVLLLFYFLIKTDYSNLCLQIGGTLIIFSIFEFIGNRVDTIPNFIESLSRNSLLIYVIHLIIVYGSPASIGLYQIVGKTLPALPTIIIAGTMLILMIIISLRIDKLKVTKFKMF